MKREEEGHPLYDTDNIIRTYYDEMFLTGHISEETFDREGRIPPDTDSLGNIVSRDFSLKIKLSKS